MKSTTARAMAIHTLLPVECHSVTVITSIWRQLARVHRVLPHAKAIGTTWLLRRDVEIKSLPTDVTGVISVVIPVHDAPEVTARCLRSLETFGVGAEVVVVDDGSEGADTRRFLDVACRRNGWRLLRNETAHGHSRACEQGAVHASRELICFLNSDTVVTSVSWGGVVDVFRADDQIAVVGPTTSWAATAQRDDIACICRHRWSDHQIELYARRYVSRQSINACCDLEQISGCAFFIRRTLWRQYGGFHKALSDYGNETELCTRIQKDGLRCVWTRNAYVHHFGEQSYSGVSLEYRRAMQSFIDALHEDCASSRGSA